MTKPNGLWGRIEALSDLQIRAKLPPRMAARLPVQAQIRPPEVARRRSPEYWDDMRQQMFHIADIVIGMLCVVSLWALKPSWDEPLTWERFKQFVGPGSAVLYMTFIGMITIANDAAALFAKARLKLKEIKRKQGDLS